MTIHLLSASADHWAQLGSELVKQSKVADVRIHVDNSVTVTTSKFLLGSVSDLLRSIFEEESRSLGGSFSATCFDLFLPGFEGETVKNALGVISLGETRVTGAAQMKAIRSFLQELRIRIDLELVSPSNKDPSIPVEDVETVIPKTTEERKSGSCDDVLTDEATKFAKITVNESVGPSLTKARHRIRPRKNKSTDRDMLASNNRHNREEERPETDLETRSIPEPTRKISRDKVMFGVKDDDAELSGPEFSSVAVLPASDLNKNCPVCQEVFYNKTELIRHIACLHYPDQIRQFHRGTKFECGICKVRFTHESNTLRHVLSVHNGLSYISLDNPIISRRRPAINCTVCGDTFRHRSLMLVHKARDHFAEELKVMYGEREWQCGLCGEIKSKEDFLILHLIKVHHMQSN